MDGLQMNLRDALLSPLQIPLHVLGILIALTQSHSRLLKTLSSQLLQLEEFTVFGI